MARAAGTGDPGDMKPRTARSRTIARRLAVAAVPVLAATAIIGTTAGHALALPPSPACTSYTEMASYWWNEYTALSYEEQQAWDEGDIETWVDKGTQAESAEKQADRYMAMRDAA